MNNRLRMALFPLSDDRNRFLSKNKPRLLFSQSLITGKNNIIGRIYAGISGKMRVNYQIEQHRIVSCDKTVGLRAGKSLSFDGNGIVFGKFNNPVN